MFRYLCVALLSLAVTSAEYLYGEYPALNYNTEYASAYDNYKPRDYKFEYGVSDPHTGDHKSQWEVRENGVVRGAYSLLEADGTTRVVEYYADDTGFHADVKKIGTAVHSAPEAHIAVAPVVKTHIADGIAYNGYGHGGLEHGYGAPISAIQHIAVAPQILAPVQHIAPIAKVEHIAPVQQVIAPEFHHLQQYAPIHLDKYASSYAQASPAHFAHEYKLEHAPIVAKAHYAQIPQSPLIANIEKYAPIAYAAEAKYAPIDKYAPIAPAYYNDFKAYAPIDQGHYNVPIGHGQYEHAQVAAPTQHIEKAHVAPAVIDQALYVQNAHIAQAPIQQGHYIEKAPIVYQQELAPQYIEKHIAPAAHYVEKAHIAPVAYEQAQYIKEAQIAPAVHYLQKADIGPIGYEQAQYVKDVHVAPPQYIKQAAQYIEQAPIQYSQHATKIHHDQHNYPQYYEPAQAQAHYSEDKYSPVSYNHQTKIEHKPVMIKNAEYYDDGYKQEIKSDYPYADYSQHHGY